MKLLEYKGRHVLGGGELGFQGMIIGSASNSRRVTNCDVHTRHTSQVCKTQQKCFCFLTLDSSVEPRERVYKSRHHHIQQEGKPDNSGTPHGLRGLVTSVRIFPVYACSAYRFTSLNSFLCSRWLSRELNQRSRVEGNSATKSTTLSAVNAVKFQLQASMDEPSGCADTCSVLVHVFECYPPTLLSYL